jgi:hypothetical protein
MPPEKQKVDKAPKIVEVSAELLEENAQLPAAIEAQADADSTFVSAVSSEHANAPLPPTIALKTTLMKALPFVLISFVLFGLPFVMSDFNVLWLKYSQVRTYMMCALIWNLIGACLYAQVDKRNQKILIFLIFALPLITSHHWASFMYVLEMGLRSIFNAPL